MVKNVQIKIILIFTIITTVLITGLSIYFFFFLQNINIKLTTQPIQEVIDYTNTFIANGKILTIYAIFAFLLIAIVIAIFITKKVTKPINKLISSAKKIAAGEEIQIGKDIETQDKEVNEIVDAFGIMTKELKENLNEVSRKKNQIETILLHMTDGIIAFNMDGKIILVNPAATSLLRILPEDETFEIIFKKLNININMEKIIYLDNWTSSEERINLGDKHINLF